MPVGDEQGPHDGATLVGDRRLRVPRATRRSVGLPTLGEVRVYQLLPRHGRASAIPQGCAALGANAGVVVRHDGALHATPPCLGRSALGTWPGAGVVAPRWLTPLLAPVACPSVIAGCCSCHPLWLLSAHTSPACQLPPLPSAACWSPCPPPTRPPAGERAELPAGSGAESPRPVARTGALSCHRRWGPARLPSRCLLGARGRGVAARRALPPLVTGGGSGTVRAPPPRRGPPPRAPASPA